MSVAKRVAVACAIAFAITRILPSLADTNTPNPQDPQSNPTQIMDSTTVTPSTSPSPSASSSESAAPVAQPSITYVPSESSQPTSSASPSPSAISNPQLTVHIPATIKVDPRAQLATVAPIHIESSSDLLVCLNSTGASILLGDLGHGVIGVQGSAQSLFISGSAAALSATLNQGTGLRLYSSGHVASASIDFAFVGVSAPTTNSALCSKATDHQAVSVSALGLQENLVKVPLTLAKKP